MRLAQAEMAEKGKRAGLGLGLFSAAGLVAVFGLGTLVTTAILALALVVPAWLAGLIVAVVLFVVAARPGPERQEQRRQGHAGQARGGPGRPPGGHRHREGGAQP